MKVAIIVAAAKNHAIGKDNRLLWRLPADLKFFKNLTTHHHIIMGRKTFESIGKPLPDRTNIIISRQENLRIDDCLVFNNIPQAIEFSRQQGETETFIIGGAEIYTQALPFADKVYLTSVHTTIEGDAFFPELDPMKWKETARQSFSSDEKNPLDFDFIELERIDSR